MGSQRSRSFLPVDFNDARYRGKWVVLLDDAVVDADRDLCACLSRVRSKHPGREPTVVKLSVPTPRSGAQHRLV